jgi:hypothetical protein
MCGLCGVFGVARHWTDTAAEVASRRAERQHRTRIANRVLLPLGLELREWSGRYTLTGRTGRSAVVDNLGAIWPAAERLAGRPLDPLDPDLIARIGAARRS